MYDIVIDGEISIWNYGARRHRENLSRLDGDINIFISSFGGDFYEAIDIFNMNREYSRTKGEVTITVGSKAMSAGAIITMSADKKIAHKNSTFMIHRAWTIMLGNSVQFNQEAKILNAIDIIQANSFKEKMGKTDEEMMQLLTDDTYYVGEEELRSTGIFDEIIEADEVEKESVPTKAFASAKKSFAKKAEDEEYSPDLEKAKKAIKNCNGGNCVFENTGVNPSSYSASAQITNKQEGNSMEYTKESFQALEKTHAEALKDAGDKLSSAQKTIEDLNQKIAAEKEKADKKAKILPEIVAMGMKHGVDEKTFTQIVAADTMTDAKIALMEKMESDGAFGVYEQQKEDDADAEKDGLEERCNALGVKFAD